VYFRCHSRSCQGSSVRQDRIENAAQHVFGHFLLDESVREAIRIHIESKHATSSKDDTRQDNFSKLKLEKINSRLSGLTDLLLDSAISKEEHKKKRNDLLIEQARIEQTAASVELNKHKMQERLRPILEPQNLFTTEEKTPFLAKNREIIKSFTSNLLLRGRNVELELKKPFDELGKYGGVYECRGLPDDPRTFCQFCANPKCGTLSEKERTAAVVEILENYSYKQIAS